MANLKDSLDALIAALQQDMKDREQTRKARDEKQKRDEEKKAVREFKSAASKFIDVGKSFERFMKPVMEFQTSMTSMGRSLDGTMKNVIGGSLPLQTRMVGTMAVLRNGLESNSTSLGRLVIRAAALGENINMLASGFRDIRTSLGLNSSQLNELGTYVVDSAKTYRVSSDQLVKSIADLSKKLAVLGFAGAEGSMKALSDAVARTSLAAPGGLAQVLGPMMSGGIESIATAQMTGLQPLLVRLVNNQVTSSDEIFASLQGFVDRIDANIKPALSQGPQVANTLLQQLYGINFETYNTMRVMLEEAKNVNPVQQRLAASMDDAVNLLNQLGPRLAQPLAELAALTLRVVEFLGPVVPILTSIVTGLVAMRGIMATMVLLGKQANFVRDLINGTLRQQLAADLRSQGISGFGARLGGLGLLLGPLGALATTAFMLYQSSKNSEESLSEMNEREKRKDLPSIEDINRQAQTVSVASIGNILAATMRGRGVGEDRDFQRSMNESLRETMEETNRILKQIYEGRNQLPEGAGSPLSGERRN
jgi:hypothetical protein